MQAILNRLFGKRRPSSSPGDVSGLSSELSHGDIENYYLRIIMDCLRRLMVPVDTVSVGVKPVGRGPTGLPAFAGYLRIVRWDAVLAPVLLQNLPVLDAGVRKVVDASVILEHTHFDGLWVQAHGTMPGAPTALVGMPAQLVRQPSAGEGRGAG
ncbi:hypothetical protein [Ramlibacter sp.]|uniref:hypothetical protein n=1 Tax=Ramlibacter sp. TaxID=1917967 RepID=UPI0018192BBC|nr:hypothetical protein [Ramlibacter sp.]MBA2674163.1 hypothetical protein [Ramlibacter sp.]